MSKISLVIVVLEDDHHKMLIYRYLINCGLKGHEIRIQRSPSGEGSAEGWVRKTFVREIDGYRSRQARTALVVLVDADILAVQDRIAQLDQSLKNSGRHTVAESEQIARLIPKRNVETWVLSLNGQTVEEQTDYKRTNDDWNKLIPAAAKSLFEWTRPQAEPPRYCVESLRSGIRELKRLKF